MEHFWGKYRAEVLDVKDPLMRGRIKVKCESLLPNKPELGWAESCFMPGEFNLPRKGDLVWIEFEGGDIQLPIWVGIMPTRKYVKEHLFSKFSDRTHYDPSIKILKSNSHEGFTFYDGSENKLQISSVQVESLTSSQIKANQITNTSGRSVKWSD